MTALLRTVGLVLIAWAGAVSASVAVTGSQARAFLGGRTGKMVYAKTFDHKLYFVDFNDSVPVERKISDDTYPLNPKISPDGTRIVYECIGSIYVRELVANSQQRWTVLSAPYQSGRFYEPHWWINPANGDEYILYSTGDDTENEWPPKTGSTFLKRWVTTVKNKSDTLTQVLLPFTMGGGRSLDGKWGATADHTTGMYQLYPDRLSDAFFAEKNWLDLGAYLNCNPSISPSQDPARQNRMLHLSSGLGNWGGKSYDNHKAVVMRSWDDPDLDHPIWFMGPLGEKVDDDSSGNLYWHHCEWSNDENYFVLNGSTIIENWDTADVYLIKINYQGGNSKPLRVLKGGGINVDPDLWIKNGLQPARIRLEKSELQFVSLRQDTVKPADIRLHVTNAGDGTLPALQIGALPKWLRVSLDSNGTNAPVLINHLMRDSVLPGDYRASVVVTFGGGVDSATYTVAFNYRDPVLTTLVPSALNVVVLPGNSARFAALALDQTGDTLRPQPKITWTSTDSGVILDQDGIYLADTVPHAPRTFTVTGKSDTVSCKISGIVARVWQRADAGGLRGHTDFPAAAWDNAPDFEVANTDRNPQRLADSIQVKLATGFDAFEPAPDSVYRSYETLEHFRFPGLPKGRYWVRIHGLTPGLSDTTKVLAISMKLEGKLAYEGHFPLPTKTKTWSAVSFYAKTTVSDTDGLYGELVGFAAAQIYVAGIEVFDVGLPPVTVLAPNGGEKYTVGDTVRIHWNTDGVVNSVGIQVSLDSGKSMIPVTRTESIELGEKAWGDYAWVIPDSLDGKSLVGTGTMISIYDYFGSDRDKSDATFTLEGKAASLQPGAIAALKRPFQARWLSGLGVQLQGLKPGVVDLALMDSQGRYQSFQRHIPVSTQGDARWNTQVNRGLYRLWIRQGTAKRAVPLLVF